MSKQVSARQLLDEPTHSIKIGDKLYRYVVARKGGASFDAFFWKMIAFEEKNL